MLTILAALRFYLFLLHCGVQGYYGIRRRVGVRLISHELQDDGGHGDGLHIFAGLYQAGLAGDVALRVQNTQFQSDAGGVVVWNVPAADGGLEWLGESWRGIK